VTVATVSLMAGAREEEDPDVRLPFGRSSRIATSHDDTAVPTHNDPLAPHGCLCSAALRAMSRSLATKRCPEKKEE
jgi:hypothetical protein